MRVHMRLRQMRVRAIVFMHKDEFESMSPLSTFSIYAPKYLLQSCMGPECFSMWTSAASSHDIAIPDLLFVPAPLSLNLSVCLHDLFFQSHCQPV